MAWSACSNAKAASSIDFSIAMPAEAPAATARPLNMNVKESIASSSVRAFARASASGQIPEQQAQIRLPEPSDDIR